VRFGELKGLTSLPIPRLVEQFRNEEVLTVLPVRDALAARESLLVATRPKLAVLTTLAVPAGEWVTWWAPWDAVSVAEPTTPPAEQDDLHRLTIVIGGQTFHAALRGEAGRKALRDLVAAIRTSRPTHPIRP
jgi:hypothetical protein